DAAAHEVTPPLTSGPAWTAERIDWFLDHHRRARCGVDGPAGEATWAVMLEGRPVGAVRLRRLDADTLETGIWLGRSARGCGAGTGPMQAVLARARQERAGPAQARRRHPRDRDLAGQVRPRVRCGHPCDAGRARPGTAGAGRCAEGGDGCGEPRHADDSVRARVRPGPGGPTGPGVDEPVPRSRSPLRRRPLVPR